MPIGRPVDNTRVYVLDRAGNLLPAGVPGDLHVGGIGVGRGYLDRPDLTADRFVPDPFAGEPGARLYRTGDLARRRRDGLVEYLGRLDHQVKVRGVRIELGEIEAVLESHPQVREAVVVARKEQPEEVRLDERQLAQDLGVSRTPVREAMAQLEREGFVRSVPRRGVYVVRKTRREVIEMITAWAALEGMAARLITTNAADGDIARLRTMFTRFENGERSKQPSSTTNTLKLFENASITLERTQPEVLVPHTSSVSTPRFQKYDASGVPKNADAFVFSSTYSSGRGAMALAIGAP